MLLTRRADGQSFFTIIVHAAPVVVRRQTLVFCFSHRPMHAIPVAPCCHPGPWTNGCTLCLVVDNLTQNRSAVLSHIYLTNMPAEHLLTSSTVGDLLVLVYGVIFRECAASKSERTAHTYRMLRRRLNVSLLWWRTSTDSRYTHTNESMTVRDRSTTYDLCAVNSTQMPPARIPCRHVGKKVLVAFYLMFTKRINSRDHLWWERVTYLSASFLSGTHAVARAW